MSNEAFTFSGEPPGPKGCFWLIDLFSRDHQHELDARQNLFDSLNNKGLLASLQAGQLNLPVKLDTPGFHEKQITPRWPGGLTIERIERVWPQLQALAANFGLTNPQFLIGTETARLSESTGVLFEGVLMEIKGNQVLLGPVFNATMEDPDTFPHRGIRPDDYDLTRIPTLQRLASLASCASLPV